MKKIKFAIDCEMQERWVPYFLSMLKDMEQLGKTGMSRKVSIYCDGDGDFRPTFNWDTKLNANVRGHVDEFGDILYDAG